jgi:proton-translocating NADH-quinone oxidoreductase chain L
MYLVLVFSPLLGSLCGGFFGRYLGYRGAGLITTGSVLLSAILSGIAFYEVALSGSVVSIPLFPWFFSELFDGGWGFYFDTLTVVMAVVVTGVSLLVHLYGFSYMSHDPHIPRFMSYLSIFTFFMLMLVTADNLVQTFFGWEGVGVASYLLINFWSTRLQASKASIKAMLVNRVGDFGLALGIMALFTTAGTVNFSTAFAVAPLLAENSITGLERFGNSLLFCTMELDSLTIITSLLFIGAVGKSAQLFLHTWLPDAMEGPTPVSALIHAATMVTAGVFLIARCSPLFEYAPSTLLIVAFSGAMTCFFAGTVGLVQNDIKRVIAYSTCSQLGYMVFACGLSQYSLGIFHLMNHAFFKALLFLSAGSVIHGLSDEQDMRRMGGVVQSLPFTYGMTLIGSMSLVGFPFLTGFYSKDSILEVGYATYTLTGNFGYWLTAVSVLCTSYYSFRLLFLSFLSESSGFRKPLEGVHDAPPLMALPLLPLAVGSLFVGFLAKDMMIGLGTDFWGGSLFVLPKNLVQLESEYIPLTQKLAPLLYTFLGFSLALVLNYGYPFSSYRACITPYENFSSSRTPFGVSTLPYPRTPKGVASKTSIEVQEAITPNSMESKEGLVGGFGVLGRMGRAFYTFLNRRWFFDKVYNHWLGEGALHFGYHTSWKALDKGCFEILGPYGIAQTFPHWSRQLTLLQSGMIYHYAVMILLGLTLAITLILLRDLLQAAINPFFYLLFPLALLFYNDGGNP